MPWFSPPAIQYISRFSNPPDDYYPPENYGYMNPPEYHAGGSHYYKGRLYRGGGRYHHHGRRPAVFHPGGGARYHGEWHPGGGHYEWNPDLGRNAWYPDLPMPGGWHESMRDLEEEERHGQIMGSLSEIEGYELNPWAIRHTRQVGPFRTRRQAERWADGHAGARSSGISYLYKPNPPGCIENDDGSQSCWYSNPHEPRHDVLCQCGWGRLGMPESQIPDYCPVCGHPIGHPGHGGGHSPEFWEGVESEQEDWDDPSWGAAYGDAGWGVRNNPLLAIVGNPPVERNACYGLHWHQERPFTPPRGLFEATHGYPRSPADYLDNPGTSLRDKIREAVRSRDARLAGRIAEQLRFRHGLRYNDIYAVFQKHTGISKREFEGLMYEAEGEGHLDNPGENPDYYGVYAQRRHYGPFHSVGPARSFARQFHGREFDLYDPALSRANPRGKYFTRKRTIEGKHGPRIVERPWSHGTIPRTLETSKQHKSRMKGIIRSYAKKEFGTNLRDKTITAMLGKSRADLAAAGKPKLAEIKARADQVFYATTRELGLLPGTKVPKTQRAEPAKKPRRRKKSKPKSKPKAKAKAKRKKRVAGNRPAPKDAVRCTKKKKGGARCKGRRLPGKKVCVFHSSLSSKSTKGKRRKKVS